MTYYPNANDIPVLTALTDDQVAEYLRNNPDFFINKPDLLADIQLPHPVNEGTISLVERQVAILRERNMDMRHRLHKLLDNARANDAIFEKTKRLLLELLATNNLEDLTDALFSIFHTDFEIHYSHLMLIAPSNTPISPPSNQQVTVVDAAFFKDKLARIVKNNRAICGQLEASEQQFIFSEYAEEIGSTAVAPLKMGNQLLGVLAIANRDINFYRSSMNTLFLNFIADCLSRLLIQHWPSEME